MRDDAAQMARGHAPPDADTDPAPRWLLIGLAAIPLLLVLADTSRRVFALDVDDHPTPQAPAAVGEPEPDHHRKSWQRLSQGEQLALRQLADEGFFNPNNGDVARTVLASGLIRRERGFEFADPAFAAFVRHEVPSATIDRWEHEGVTGGWDDVRAHLGAVIAVAGTLVFVTQPDLFNTLALAFTGVAGVPTLMKLISVFGNDKPAAK